MKTEGVSSSIHHPQGRDHPKKRQERQRGKPQGCKCRSSWSSSCSTKRKMQQGTRRCSSESSKTSSATEEIMTRWPKEIIQQCAREFPGSHSLSEAPRESGMYAAESPGVSGEKGSHQRGQGASYKSTSGLPPRTIWQRPCAMLDLTGMSTPPQITRRVLAWSPQQRVRRRTS